MRACALIPAFDAEQTVGVVARDVLAAWPTPGGVFVIDDGSTDATVEVARAVGAQVLAHPRNRGKGAALRTGMAAAAAAGFDVAVSLDADGQHPVGEAVRLLSAEADPQALVLGVRDLAGAGAPRSSQISNRISNFFLSLFSGRPLADTQCGLRRYPLRSTLALGGLDDGYAFEAEVILRAIAGGMRLVEVPVAVYYPPPSERLTHFDSVRDPARIIARVVHTLAVTRGLRSVPAAAASGASRERPGAPAWDRPATPHLAPVDAKEGIEGIEGMEGMDRMDASPAGPPPPAGAGPGLGPSTPEAPRYGARDASAP